MAHVNRYLTALLVVLAATGMEAQTCESALKAALGNGNIENICQQPELKSLEAEILSVIKELNAQQKKQDREPSHHLAYALVPIHKVAPQHHEAQKAVMPTVLRPTPIQGAGSNCPRAPSITPEEEFILGQV